MNKKQLKEIKEFYEMLAWRIVKNNKWGKKLPDYVQGELNKYNLIIDLIDKII